MLFKLSIAKLLMKTNRKLNIYLVAFLYFMLIYRFCFFGCLKCSLETEQCLICDSLNDYYLSHGKCAKKTIDNCIILSQTGNCYRCRKGYMQRNGLCVAEPVEQSYGCSIFQAHNSCYSYFGGFFINDILFDSVFVKINNCLENDTLSTCKVCEEGYLLSGDKKRCIKASYLSDTHNCQAHHEYSCNKCSEGYYFAFNNYYMGILNNLTQAGIDTLLNSISGTYVDSVTDNTPLFCAKSYINNCREYNEVGACVRCDIGYGLNERGSCFEIPDPKVENCERYDKNLNCLECVQSYFRYSLAECRRVHQIEHCSLYDGTAFSSRCVECDTEYYIDETSNTCVIRTHAPIENCQEYSKDEDSCASCGSGFKVSTDGRTCETHIDNCASTTMQNSELTCLECEPGYILSSNTCALGTIDHCQIYTEDQCSLCEKGYALKEGICVELETDDFLSFCAVLASDNKNCDTCNAMSSLYDISAVCALRTNTITNCIDYDANNDCIECARGYALESNACNLITVDEENCIKLQGVNTCLKCSKGYYLHLGSCIPIPQYLTHNCAEYSVDGSNITCLYCNAGSTPVILDGLRVFCEPLHTTSFELPQDCEYANYNNSCKRYTNEKTFDTDSETVVDKADCPYGLYKYYLGILDNKIKALGLDFCVEAEIIPNCKSYIPNYFTDDPDDISYICIECENGYRPIFTVTEGKSSIYTPLSTELDNRITAIKECISEVGIINKAFVTKSNFDHCEFFAEDTSSDPDFATNYFACVKCAHGYTGVPIRLDNIYFIPKCYKMEQCMSDIYYSGLSTLPNQLKTDATFPSMSFERYISCHRCKRMTDIPIAGIDDDTLNFNTIDEVAVTVSPYQLISYSLNEDPPYNSAIENTLSDTSTQCVGVSTIKGYDTGNTFPDNCGAAVVRVQFPKKLYSDMNTSILCIACKPKYKATMFDVIDYAVSACTIIEHCESSTRFNGCSKCEQGYAIKYDTTINRPVVDSCVATVDNCKYSRENGECEVCVEGYARHATGECYVADLDSCNPYDYIETKEFPIAGLVAPIYLDFYLSQQMLYEGSGCTRCREGFIKYEMIMAAKPICMKNTGILSGKVIIAGCKLYGYIGNSLTCEKCGDSYLAKPDQSGCVLKLKVPNCVSVDNSGNCIECDDFYFLSDQGRCERGKILNCLKYVNENTCHSCIRSYFLKYNICNPFPDTHCEHFDEASIASNVFECTKCKQPHYELDSSLSYSTCIPFIQTVPNCLDYDKAANPIMCSLCKEGFYLNSRLNRCLERTEIQNCIAYSLTQDACIDCAKGFRLSLDQKKCKPNPTGILYCERYQNPKICSLCKTNYILEDNKCSDLNSNNRIDNCKYHVSKSDEVECVSCYDGYYLLDNTCYLSKIGKCKTATGPGSCKQCADGYSLVNAFGIDDCVRINIPNCRILDPSTRRCSVCKIGYYLDSSSLCSPTNYIISGCDEYAGEDICRKCTDGKILDKSKKICHRIEANKVSNIDPHCVNGAFSLLPRCVKCAYGHYFTQSKQCVACEAGENCMFCLPANPLICLLCSPGSFMNREGKCIGMVPNITISNSGISKKGIT